MRPMDRYEALCRKASRNTTRQYSTSFSIGIRSLEHDLRAPIHAIYGFVRFADEIVDTFHGYDKAALLARFRDDTHTAVREGISLNPILHSFQRVVHEYGIEAALYDTFLDSMAMDLQARTYDRPAYDRYIHGSAEVVGAMCLRVFTKGDQALYHQLLPAAMRLGAAFQKVNFLRDLKQDHRELGRTYFPGVDLAHLDNAAKRRIENDIRADLDAGRKGIGQLPRAARLGVYVAYVYYRALFRKIQALPCDRILHARIRVRNSGKLALFTTSYLRHSLGLIR